MSTSLLPISGHVIMLDPASPEVNRGSFCYLSYLLYSGLKFNPAVEYIDLQEEFRVSDFDHYSWDKYDHVLIALWSYPQVETALILHRFLKGKCRFYGYYPLIERLGLPPAYYHNSQILEGMKHYPKLLCKDAFEYVLLSDCDKHIKDSNKRVASGIEQKMVPMFTSYGCPMGCKFCSATVNCNKVRLVLPMEDVFTNLDILELHGKRAVHFTDEDFFFDPQRAVEILLTAYHICKDFEFIALGEVHTVDAFCDHVNTKLFPQDQEKIWHVLRLIEIGYETADPDLAAAMGKGGRNKREKAILLGAKCPCPILWLTVTFYPGETIKTLNATGQFMELHGFDPENMEERIVTNGTVGGLGQFFQYYDGCGLGKRELGQKGVVLTETPMRLIPSFLPMSFLNSEFVIDWDVWEQKNKQFFYWQSVYGVKDFPAELWAVISDENAKNEDRYSVSLFFEMAMDDDGFVPRVQASEIAICIAIMARLNIIKGV